MGFPHPTLDIPGSWPTISDELLRVHNTGILVQQLEQGLRGDSTVVAGHICATAWVFSPDARYVLFVRHRTLGWSAPGGHVERHESSHDAGLRELEEETGLTRFDVRSLLLGPALVHVTDRGGEQPHRHWNIAWLYTAEMDAPLSPIEGARWFPVDHIPFDGASDLPETTAALIEIVVRS